MGVEFIGGAVELSVTLAADIGAGLVEVVILTGERPFGPFGLDDVLLFSG
jgi:NAD(P)H-hydrate repair Nnr-like enzyme with NAD(P)H-hydrate dehydratase domain